nr:hypothetical protein [uncultured Ruminococcus sp.]
MKNPNSKSNKINIIFSSFLVIGYIICTYFFSSIASQVTGTWGSVIQILIMVIFGLLLFYATRVGEGKQVKRFSLAVLLLIDIPALYIILAALVPALPLHNLIVPQNATLAMMGVGSSGPSIILMLACVALGYGIPYTFFAGYEMKEEGEEEAEEKAEEAPVLEGGLAEELAETEKDAEAKADEAVEEAADNAEEATETAEEVVEQATDDKESEKEAE